MCLISVVMFYALFVVWCGVEWCMVFLHCYVVGCISSSRVFCQFLLILFVTVPQRNCWGGGKEKQLTWYSHPSRVHVLTHPCTYHRVMVWCARVTDVVDRHTCSHITVYRVECTCRPCGVVQSDVAFLHFCGCVSSLKKYPSDCMVPIIFPPKVRNVPRAACTGVVFCGVA
jgi:hypothetical protein